MLPLAFLVLAVHDTNGYIPASCLKGPWRMFRYFFCLISLSFQTCHLATSKKLHTGTETRLCGPMIKYSHLMLMPSQNAVNPCVVFCCLLLCGHTRFPCTSKQVCSFCRVNSPTWTTVCSLCSQHAWGILLFYNFFNEESNWLLVIY